MVTSNEQLERFLGRTMAGLRRLSAQQRDVVVLRILRDDPDLARALPTLVETYAAFAAVRRMGPLRRDSVGSPDLRAALVRG